MVERVRTLAFRSNADMPKLRKRLRRAIEAEDFDRASAALRALAPAWVARCALPLLDPELEPPERVERLEDRLMDARVDALRWMRALRASATIASALGFIGAAAQIWWVFNGEHGLEALQAGNVENEGLSKAVLSIAIGIATSSFALGSWTVLKKVAAGRVADCRRLVASVEDALGVDE